MIRSVTSPALSPLSSTLMDSSIPSGLTIDGIAIPQTIEADGPAAVEAHLADVRGESPIATTPAPVIETAPNPPTVDEGAEA